LTSPSGRKNIANVAKLGGSSVGARIRRVPGKSKFLSSGAIRRPADGEEHVHGRWLVIEGKSGGKAAAVGVASSGQHGFDFLDGELRLSVLRSSAYCHEQEFDLDAQATKTGRRTGGTCPSGAWPSAWKFADIGVHEFRLLACKRSWDGEALIVRLQEAVGRKTKARPGIAACAAQKEERGHIPSEHVPLSFQPFEIKTLRVERDGTWRPVRMIEEDR
jgi:hypothetical protein